MLLIQARFINICIRLCHFAISLTVLPKTNTSAMATRHKYDYDIVSQLMWFGYTKAEIIRASAKVVDYTDINAIQEVLYSEANIIPC